MTLRLLAELDQQMAAWFQEETEFRVTGQFILQPQELSSEQVTRLTFLEQVGLLHHVVPIGGLVQTLTPDPDGYALLIEGDLCLRVRMDGEASLEIIPITRIGQEIARIFPPVDSIAVLRRLGKALRDKSKSMEIRCILSREGDSLEVSDPIEVLKSSAEGE